MTDPRTAERCAERLLAEPGLQHDEAQAALAATFSVPRWTPRLPLSERRAAAAVGAGPALLATGPR